MGEILVSTTFTTGGDKSAAWVAETSRFHVWGFTFIHNRLVGELFQQPEKKMLLY